MSSVSVVIVNWNGRQLIVDCLQGLQEQSVADFRIIVVDNGSSDGSPQFLADTFPDIELITLDRNTGFAIANNTAFGALDTEYVALLNNDARPHRDWLGNLIRTLELHPEAGFAASKMLFHDNRQIVDRAGDVYTRAGTAWLRGRGQPAGSYCQTEYIFGACAGAALYRSAMLKEIGFFDDDFFLLYEDVDLSFRAQLQGYPCLFVPEAIVYHKASSTVGDDSLTSVYYSHRNLEWVYIKNMPAPLIPKTILQHLVYDIAALIYFSTMGQLVVFLKAKWHALKGLRKMLAKRRRIQRCKRVTDQYIWGLLESEMLLPRLARRLKRSA
jgi:GT2 family glycosyltransferase